MATKKPSRPRKQPASGSRGGSRASADDRLTTESSADAEQDVVVAKTEIIVADGVGQPAAVRESAGLDEVTDLFTTRFLRPQAESLARSARRTAIVRGVEAARGSMSIVGQDPTLPDIAELSDLDLPKRRETSPRPVDVARPDLRRIEAIIGDDERERVRDTRDYPFRAIVSLEITTRDGAVGIGSGWFISARTVVTAGHCVFIRSSNPARHGWVRKVRVIPGRDGALSPFGFAVSTAFKSVRGWTQDGDEGFDYGAIVLPDTHPLGTKVGSFGIGVFADAEAAELAVTVAGYPADKKGGETGTQWYHAQTIAAVRSRQYDYAVDTMGGQSGSPVFCVANGKDYVAVAVHAYGGDSSNSGTRITPEVSRKLQEWKA
jgi:glutamyl endopeptidase